MNQEAKGASRPTLEEIRKQFETWRKTRKKYRPIPRDLWCAAAALTRYYPINTVSKTLRLNYTDLKRHVHEAETDVPSGAATGPAFVELDVPESTSGQCMVEMENRAGARLTMYCAGSDWNNLVELARVFWDMHP